MEFAKMMPLTLQPSPESFTHQLAYYSQGKFTGRLDIKVLAGEQWSLYLHLGRLAWATGGRHPVRRWHRHLCRFCPGVNPSVLIGRHNEQPECSEYHALGLLALRNALNIERLGRIVEEIINEVLFDLLRAIAIASVRHDSDRLNPLLTTEIEGDGEDRLQPSFKILPVQGVRPSKSGMLPHILMLPVTTALQRAQAEWQNWVTAGLTHCSPDLAPILMEALAFPQKTVPNAYQNLVATLDGKHTLRDIAVLTQRDVLFVTRSLLPYLHQQFVKFVQISDCPRGGTKQKPASARPPKKLYGSSSQPLVAAIDDSPKVLACLEEILSSTGCRFLGIPEPVQALPTLIQYKPDLIFLDLAMPIANGYEICAQIRRVKQFRDIPIVILTGNDGFLGRMRSKVVGATDFLSKPVQTQQVLSLLRKHCPLNVRV
ncbi:MAG: response regulator [Cyanobacteriota bacterium]|nr:response regulator [Cyanobacteriota bacterium]